MPKLKIAKIDLLNISLVLAFLVLLYLLINKHIIFGSVTGNFAYRYINNITIRPILTFFILTPLILYLVYLTHKYIQKRDAKIIVLWLIAGFIFQILIQSLYPYPLETLVQSLTSNAYYEQSLKYSPKELLSNFHSIDLFGHSRNNMPGKILFFHFLGIWTRSPQIMGYLIIIFSNLGAVLVYYISKILFRDKLIAIYSLILYLFIPAKLFFFPILNTISPVFILLLLLIFILYLEQNKIAYLFLCGILTYLILLFDPLTLVLGIMFIFIYAKYHWEKKLGIFHFLKTVSYSLLSFFLIHFCFLLFFKFNIIKTFITVSKMAMSFNIKANRSYGIWIINNPKDFLINLGIMPAILFLIRIVYLVKEIIQILKSKFNEEKRITKIIFESGNLITLSFLTVLIFIVFIGINRGETIRLWIFLMVFVQIIVSHFCVKKLNFTTFYLILMSMILQTIITISMVSFLNYNVVDEYIIHFLK